MERERRYKKDPSHQQLKTTEVPTLSSALGVRRGSRHLFCRIGMREPMGRAVKS